MSRAAGVLRRLAAARTSRTDAATGRRTQVFGCRGMTVAAVAVAAATGLAACGSSGGSGSGGGSSSSAGLSGGYGSVPAQHGTAKKGGTVTVAEQPGSTPNWILPVTTSASNTVYNDFSFGWEAWTPLYYQATGVTPTVDEAMSPADAPKWSNNDKTVTITMKKSWKWSNGQPVTAKDLMFTIDEIKAAIKQSPANWAAYVPGNFPATLTSMTSPNAQTVVMNLKNSVNPTWFEDDILTFVTPMPAAQWAKTSANGSIVDFTNSSNAAKIYKFLSSQSKSLGTYSSNPLWRTVDGPYKLTNFNASSGAYTMVPNSAYGGAHPGGNLTVKMVPFQSEAAEFNAEKAGTLDVGVLPESDLPQSNALKRQGYNYFGYPEFGFNAAFYNFKDTTGDWNNIVKQLYFRQAMAHLVDQKGYVNAFFHGAGGYGYGPIPALPKSPFQPADAASNPYPFSVTDATNLLKSHGWTINSGGTDVCSNPGNGSNQCGSGIPKGTKLSFNLIYNSQQTFIGQMDTDLASKAKKAGINIKLQSSNFDYIISNYIDPAAPANVNKWAMNDFGGETNSVYPTTYGLFNTGGSTQIGDYSNSTADKLIQASISSSSASAVKSEASFLTKNQPALFQPEPDVTYVWKNTLSGPPAQFASLTQYYLNPQYWYLTK